MPDLSPEHQRLIEMVKMSPEPSAALDALALKLARLEKLEAWSAEAADALDMARGLARFPEDQEAMDEMVLPLLAAREEETT